MISSENIAEDRLAAIQELLFYSQKIRLEFPQDLYNIQKKYIDFLQEDPDLEVTVFNNFEVCTVEVKTK